ncbi:sulfatase-like hydrolase/transferase [Chitinophaga sp. Cy-1792]|uniref:sulfatase-like hydrolase/transferase n=1 Tax=Chitinophaga sp. Cy-1792 TaxID=2608339 RepID=UPI001423FE93|nr:sulfatase-like hydrolase/transferase [Chitinophaga sp. Cy-1792]NIG56009.1 sulfatase-like hydrolase/transferase [Chitinophaga sp. Cy-1792]
MISRSLLLFMSCLVVAPKLTASPAPPFKSKPNVIWIIVDDLGYSDLSSYGNKDIHTPHIDGLAAQGVRFTRAYATAPICGPAREGIITGRYQQRFGGEYMPYEHISPEYRKKLAMNYLFHRKKFPGLQTLRVHMKANLKNHVTGLNKDELTIADVLKKDGYATGLVGKWNEGYGENFYPDKRGFDYSYYFQGALTRYVEDPIDTNRYKGIRLPWAFSDIPAWAPRYGSSAIMEGRNIVKDTGYLTFSLAEKATAFIDKNKNNPFFLALAFNAPHDPFQAPVEYMNKVSQEPDPVKRVYYAMILALDDAVGQVEAKLKAAGIADNTLIFFISDNGGAAYTRATDNAPLRGGKCTQFEGGLVVPCFMKFPAAWQSASVYSNPVSALDMFATTVAVTGTPLPADRPYDGVNLIPFINRTVSGVPHPVLYWRNGYTKAIRENSWKLYLNEKDNKIFLFNLEEDPSEKNNLATKYPEKVAALKSALHSWEVKNTISPKWPSGADIHIRDNNEWLWFPS